MQGIIESTIYSGFANMLKNEAIVLINPLADFGISSNETTRIIFIFLTKLKIRFKKNRLLIILEHP